MRQGSPGRRCLDRQREYEGCPQEFLAIGRAPLWDRASSRGDSVGSEPNHVIRPLTQADEPLLRRMLYHAIYVPEGHALPGPGVVNSPEIARYVSDWGQVDDRGFVALDGEGKEAIGAAWIRLLRGYNKGFGYVDETTPELSVAVLPEYRGQGVGKALLTELLRVASERHEAVSLSVDAGNPALRFCQRLGFDIVGASGTSLTMKKTLTEGLDAGVQRMLIARRPETDPANPLTRR